MEPGEDGLTPRVFEPSDLADLVSGNPIAHASLVPRATWAKQHHGCQTPVAVPIDAFDVRQDNQL